MKPKKNISYHLLSDMTEEQYAALPEEVRRVYVSAAKKIPMGQREKLATIQAYPQYFEKREAKPFGQKVKRILNLKTKIEKIKKKQPQTKWPDPFNHKVLAWKRGRGKSKLITDIVFIPKDQVQFPEPEDHPELEGEIIKPWKDQKLKT